MADATNPEIPNPAPAPAQTAPVSAPVEAAQTAPNPAPAAEAPASETSSTVLTEALDKTPESTEAKTETPAPDATKTEAPKETPKAEAAETPKPEGQSEEPAPPPTYDPFTLPENVTLDEDRVKQFTAILSELELGGKVDHALMQQFGQKAVDFHINEVNRVVEDYTKLLQTTWERQKTDWKNAFEADPEIGGNRKDTVVKAARDFIRTHGGTPEQQKEFRDVMESSGLGNHPAMIRLLANAGVAMAEGRPLAATRPVQQKSRTETMYGRKS